MKMGVTMVKELNCRVFRPCASLLAATVPMKPLLEAELQEEVIALGENGCSSLLLAAAGCSLYSQGNLTKKSRIKGRKTKLDPKFNLAAKETET
jgi:hypothetical protein